MQCFTNYPVIISMMYTNTDKNVKVYTYTHPEVGRQIHV